MLNEHVFYKFMVIVDQGKNPPENHPTPPPIVCVRFYNVQRRCFDLRNVRAISAPTDADNDSDGRKLVTNMTFELRARKSFTTYQVYRDVAEVLSEFGVPQNVGKEIVSDIYLKMNSRSPQGHPGVVRSVRVILAEIKRKVYRCDEVVEKVSWPLMAESGESANEEEGESCAICIEEFLGGSQLCRTPCSHVYHPLCIAKWLVVKETCPMCRFPILQMDS